MTTGQKKSNAIHVLLWVAQILLAGSMIWAGFMKLVQSPEVLAAMWPWTVENPGLVKLTGVIDLVASIGLILPALLRIQPRLTIYTAYGVVVLMIVASVFHISRGEASQIGINIFFAVLAVFIAWGRSTKTPVPPKEQ